MPLPGCLSQSVFSTKTPNISECCIPQILSLQPYSQKLSKNMEELIRLRNNRASDRLSILAKLGVVPGCEDSLSGNISIFPARDL